MEQIDKQDSLANLVMWVKTSLTNMLDGMLGGNTQTGLIMIVYINSYRWQIYIELGIGL